MAPTSASLSSHDAVLAAIPASMAVAGVAGAVASLSAATAIALGSLPASGAVGYALFWAPPDTDA